MNLLAWVLLFHRYFCVTWGGSSNLKKGTLGARSPKGAKDSITLEIRYTSLLFNIFFELMPLCSRHVWASDYINPTFLFYLKSSREPFMEGKEISIMTVLDFPVNCLTSFVPVDSLDWASKFFPALCLTMFFILSTSSLCCKTCIRWNLNVFQIQWAKFY